MGQSRKGIEYVKNESFESLKESMEGALKGLKMTKTIDELMEGKFPGQITIIHTDGGIFTPYFIDTHNDVWVGKDLNGWRKNYSTDNEYWKIYEGPKKLVKKYFWSNDYTGEVKFTVATDNMSKFNWTKIPGTGIEVEE